MSNDVYKNRYVNARNLLTIQNLSITSFCRERGLSAHYAYKLLRGDGGEPIEMSDKIARKYEQAFGVEPFSLDQNTEVWARDAAAVEKQRMVAINSTLADDVSIARYWNLQRILAELNISMNDLAEFTGVHVVICRRFGSASPNMAISNEMARRLEAGLSLEASSLDQPLKDKVLTGDAHILANQKDNEVFKNRYKNVLNLLVIQNKSLTRFCRDKGLSVDQAYRLFGKGDRRPADMSDEIARKYEQAFGIEPFSLDQNTDTWAREAAVAEQKRVAAISSMLADEVSIARYWNLQQVFEDRAITTKDLSEITGVNLTHCRKFGSANPIMAISDDMARRLEASLGLEANSLDQSVKEKVVTGEAYFPVTPDAVTFLGLGPYLYRYGHIRQIIEEKGLKQSQIIKIPGFTLKGLREILSDSPVSLVSMKMARSFEAYLGLESGSVDRPVGNYEVEPDHPAFLVSEDALSLLGESESLYRYVNLRKALFLRGLSPNDLADLAGVTRAGVQQALFDNPERRVTARLARKAESALALEALSLDKALMYRMAAGSDAFVSKPHQSLETTPIVHGNRSSSMPVRLRAHKDSAKEQFNITHAFTAAMRSNEFSLVNALFASQKTVGLRSLEFFFHQNKVSEPLKQRLAKGLFAAMQQPECLANVAMEAMSRAIRAPWAKRDASDQFIGILHDRRRNGSLISMDDFRDGIFSKMPLNDDEVKALPYLLNEYRDVYCRVGHDLERHAASCIKKLTFAGCESVATAILQSESIRKDAGMMLSTKYARSEIDGPSQ